MPHPTAYPPVDAGADSRTRSGTGIGASQIDHDRRPFGAPICQEDPASARARIASASTTRLTPSCALPLAKARAPGSTARPGPAASTACRRERAAEASESQAWARAVRAGERREAGARGTAPAISRGHLSRAATAPRKERRRGPPASTRVDPGPDRPRPRPAPGGGLDPPELDDDPGCKRPHLTPPAELDLRGLGARLARGCRGGRPLPAARGESARRRHGQCHEQTGPHRGQLNGPGDRFRDLRVSGARERVYQLLQSSTTSRARADRSKLVVPRENGSTMRPAGFLVQDPRLPSPASFFVQPLRLYKEKLSHHFTCELH
jgi:hypothetical protein